MKIQLLISTFNEGINRVEQVLLPPMDDLSYLISHQYTSDKFINIPKGLIRDDVVVFHIFGAGISANRNNSIRQATGDIVVLLDDDVRLKTSYIDSIRHVFESNPVLDVACSKIKTLAGEPEYKYYPDEEKNLCHISQFKAVSSIEIAFRRQSVLNNQIWFDECLGLGSKASSGEELLFLAACYRKGLTIRFFPVYTVEHPYQSSVKNKSPYSDERLFSTGAQACALYGKLAFLINILALPRRYRNLSKEHVSACHFLKMKMAGSLYYYRNRKKHL